MLDKHIDPPCDQWEKEEDLNWIDDLYEEYSSVDDALYTYECKVYNELNRRINI